MCVAGALGGLSGEYCQWKTCGRRDFRKQYLSDDAGREKAWRSVRLREVSAW